jgi:streptogramin lyase
MTKLAALALLVTVAGSSPRVVARIQTGASPGGAVSAFGSVWVASDGAGTLVRIDPGTNRVTREVQLRPGLFSVAAGFGAVWTVNYKRDSLTRVDPASGKARSVRVGASPFDVLCAFGRVWVTSWEAGVLSEIDPHSLRIVRRIRIGPRPTGLRAAAGAVWVGFGRSATSIARVDPATSKFRRVQVGERSPSWFVAGTRDLWLQAADNRVIRVDPRTRRVTARLSVGRTLAQGSLAPDGTIWMPDKEQSRVYRIDPAKARVVDSFAAGSGAFLALRAFGSMWVASYAGDDIWRFEPGRGHLTPAAGPPLSPGW